MILEDRDEPLVFVDEAERPGDAAAASWRILIVDDEPDVHEVTLLALRDVIIEGRSLSFLHARSAAEAEALLRQEDDIAVVLLDVVMETEDAGLRLVRFLRDELGNRATRIILRTGQPGYAPEIETIRLYDINDYKTKSELTRVRLYTSITVAIRSYWQIHQLEANRRGLEMIVNATMELSRPRGLRRFAEGVVTQLCAVLGIGEEGLVCAAASVAGVSPYVLAAAGRYSAWIGQSLDSIPDDRVRHVLEDALGKRQHSFEKSTCLYFSTSGNHALAAFVDVDYPLSDVDRKLLEVFCSNIAVGFENVQLYQKVYDLAFEDLLVRLPNRNSFIGLIECRPASADCVALVDIDGFSDINSILDQAFGDQVLEAVATRLRDAFPLSVAVARVGSDVFGLLGGAGELTPERIAQIFALPFSVDGQELRLSATSGLISLAGNTDRAVEIMKNTGVALKQAKSFRRGKAMFYEPAHAIEARDRMRLLNSLRQAFSADHLFLQYQPFIDLGTGRVVGAEALLRWKTEEGQFVPPDRFIPLAEQSGLMVALGNWVMRSALQFLARLHSEGVSDFRMAINVSHVQFREPDFVEKLAAAIVDCQVDPSSVEIELTESVAIENFALIEQKLVALRRVGVAVAIDDFGTGYSSLSILRRLDVDRLKIDRAFVSGEQCVAEDSGIARMVLQLASQLGLQTIAEGIETEAQRQVLCELGCDEGQGYLFSRPLAADALLDFVKQGRA